MKGKLCRCGYRAPAEAPSCPVCSADLSGVPVTAEKSGRPPRLNLPSAAAILLFCIMAFSYQAWRAYFSAPLEEGAGTADPAALEAASFSWKGLEYTLSEMGKLRYLPAGREEEIYRALSHGSPSVRLAALNAGFYRLNTFVSDAYRLGRLVPMIKDPAPEVRAAAAANLAATLGGQRALAGAVAPWKAEILSLSSDADGRTRAFGVFLAALSGVSPPADSESSALALWRSDPLPLARLYAACTLAYLGRRESVGYLLSFRSPELAREAAFCLAYSSAPGTGEALGRLASDRSLPEAAESAAVSLKFREQLAIINK